MPQDQALERLMAVKHIVVLMMENRSFDQMLGYLTLDGMPEVNGLIGRESNPDPDGTDVPAFEFGPDETAFHAPGQPFDKSLDPCHGTGCVAEQLADGNRGFVRNFVKAKDPPREHWRLPMGYYTSRHLPVYDHLAHNYCVCDAWHSSIPGDTWPNRQYALAGQAGPSVLLKFGWWQWLKKLLGSKLPAVPVYDVPAFTRHLQDPQWRWYSHDPATLRAVDSRYRNWRKLQRDNFTYFDRRRIKAWTQALESGLVDIGDSFLDDAAKGELRDVSWIDPNFVDLHVFDPASNDDHPPSDVKAGQELVLDLYDALTKTPEWDDTLMVVVYDEHGGFYDHVTPPPVDDGSGFPTYGVRVPALVVGPRVRKHVSHELFDHTSLIKTILLRYAADPAAAIAAMGPRVANAQHLGVVLEDLPRADWEGHGDLHGHLDEWRLEAKRTRMAEAPTTPSPAPDGAGQPVVLNDFQEEFLNLAQGLRHAGLPPGQP
jgi:phospholipase C